VTCLDCTLMKKSVRNGFAEAAPIIHRLEWEHHQTLISQYRVDNLKGLW